MTNKKEKILTCYHCGNKTSMKEVANYDYHEHEEIYDYELNLNIPINVIHYSDNYSLYLCPVCSKVTLEMIHSNSAEVDYSSGSPLKTELLLYPFNKVQDIYVPKAVSGAFEAALKVRQIDGAICAIAIRRTLEMMCKDKGEQGKNLYEMLQNLSTKGTLPPILAEMASVLRELGNAAAHADEVEFNNDMVPSMIEFTQIILDYVYNLPNRIQQIQCSISKKKSEPQVKTMSKEPT